jgi:hypothetical protein
MVYTDGIHVIADELEELHKFARNIGLKRQWFQDNPRHPHYDITSSKKLERALCNGATFLTPKEFLKKIQRRNCQLPRPDGRGLREEEANLEPRD